MLRKVPPETVALVRRLYADGATLPVIKAESGITSLWTIYRCLDGKYDDGSGAPLPALPRRRHLVWRQKSRAEMVKRLWRNAEQQVAQIEARMAQSGQAPGDSERDARALAVLVRTIRELSAFDEHKQAAKEKPKSENDDSVPQDLDEFRNELARRMQALIDARTGAGVSVGPDE